MMSNYAKERLLLELRNAIADKEWAIACANMETAKGGWTCGWDGMMSEAQSRVEGCFNELNGLEITP